MKEKFFCILNIIIHGFITFFLIIYGGKYGLTDMIFKGGSKHEIIFNTVVWATLVLYNGYRCSYYLDRVFKRKENKK